MASQNQDRKEEALWAVGCLFAEYIIPLAAIREEKFE